ncbi:putative transcription factor interactor and regulator Znf-B family [Lupinus albus]|uniref:RBR-type E3 ubiquitin transferase n=1 Tax=Lupinus albus TaxID=3870 RepID=A0A6A4QJ94_LUPAL|nr:putative transcription factor interactor and regulator Znf-B family [Lupinus albus]
MSMRGSGREHRSHVHHHHNNNHNHDDNTSSSSSSSTFPSQRSRGGGRKQGHHHHGHAPQPKLRFVKKSEIIQSSSISNSDNSFLTEQLDSVTISNHNNNDACSSKAKEEGDFNDMDDNTFSLSSRLDKLLSRMEQPQLSEEHLRDNDISQQNELLVVESIYGENVFILDAWKDLHCFQIHINIEVLGEIAITAKMNSSNELESVSKNSDDFLYSFKVQYLPPIVLTCLLPKSYPSHQPPIFTISVQWLESSNISSLCSKLDSIWEEQEGQEVIYQWVEWLLNSSLSHLGFDKEIKLGPYGMNHVGDDRVVSGTSSPDVDIPLLQNYNNQKHHESFLKELHQCQICFSEYAGTEFRQLPCKHFFCLKCLQTFTQMHVKEGTISSLQCPEAKCTVMIPPGLLKHLLDDNEYERWESMMLEKTLASMSDVVYCPRCETPCIEDEDQHAQCSKCFFSFCTLCSERRHVGIVCMTLDMRLQILQDRQNSSHLKEDQKRREREKINEMLSVKEIHRDSKLCPSCDMAISRTEGCNKMVCGNCGEYFCYRCNKAIDKSDPYGHFRDGACELFPQEMIENWQERINHRQVVGQLQAELFPQSGRACPNCRQFNAKIGNNNHMFCWACQSHYCYLCNEVVRRGTKHYGPKGCKQHSEG